MSVHTCQCRCVPHVEDHCRNGEPDFPPEVIEKAARAIHEARTEVPMCGWDDQESCWPLARAVLAAVAEADTAYQRGMAEGARQVRDAVERVGKPLAVTTSSEPERGGERYAAREIVRAAHQAVASIVRGPGAAPCQHPEVRTFRSHPPHSKCLACGCAVEQRWVEKGADA